METKNAYWLCLPEQCDYTMNDANLIKFTAQVSQVRTLADGGLRIVLDLPETAIKEAGELMQVKQRGAVLEIVAVPVVRDALTAQLQEAE